MSGLVIVEAGIEFTAASVEHEPMALDLDVAKALGFGRPRDVRPLIKRLLADGFLNDSEVCGMASQTSPKGGRPGTEYRITERAALIIGSRSDAPGAAKLLRELVDVYLAVKAKLRTHVLPKPPPAPTLAGALPLLTAAQMIGARPDLKTEMACRIRLASQVQGVTWKQAEGFVRKYLGVPSYLRIPMACVGECRRILDALISQSLIIPASTNWLRRESVDRRQLTLFEGGKRGPGLAKAPRNAVVRLDDVRRKRGTE